MNKVIMLKGLAGSGKTTWAKERLKRGGCNRISMDDIRESVFGGFSEKKERLALEMRDIMIKATIAQGRDAIVDATNLNPVHERRLRALAEEIGANFEIEDSFLKSSPEECIARDLHRGEQAVGAKVIYDMYYRWVRPKPDKLLERDDKRRVIICSIDGALADESSINPLVSFLLDCVDEAGSFYADIILMTGKEEKYREELEDWLERNCIQYKQLLMRPDGNTDRIEDIKQELYLKEIQPEYTVAGVIEDNPLCAIIWRGLGFNTLCLGDFTI